MGKTNIKQTNLGYIKTYGGEVGKQVQGFSTIRTHNSKNEAITHDGLKVERTEYIYAEGYGLVKCIDYELFFVYEDKSGKIGRWVYMCSCGSMAGIISYKEMSKLMTVVGDEKGYVMACLAHTSSKQNTGLGFHADMSHE